MTGDELECARGCFGRQAWAEARDLFLAVDRESPLAPEDLERLAVAEYLLGREAESRDSWARAHQEWLRRGDAAHAARAAFWVIYGLMEIHATAEISGWISRATRILEDCGRDCVERGYLCFPTAFLAIARGDYPGAYAGFSEAGEIAHRFGDRDLMALAWHGQGRVLIRQGEAARGIALLDEAMVTITAGEVSPIVAGDIYCGTISACHDLFDWGRAREWTSALSRWCAAQPDLVPYRGQCLVRRSEIMQLQGDWPEALDEVRRACDRLSRPANQPGAGAAFYQLGELHRLRGEFAQAETAYVDAGRQGARQEPGLPLLRLAQGQAPAARAAIERALDESQERRIRARLLAPAVEILLTTGDVPAARRAADELAGIAADALYLQAQSARATGAVLLAEERPKEGLVSLRQAWAFWHELEVPYEVARTRALIGVAAGQLGDVDTAALELDSARRTFRRLGAIPDLERVAAASQLPGQPPAEGLTGRELEVLRLLAAGKTNRGIAQGLGISVKTVDRHVSNIFTKLGLGSRASAAAYAIRHHLA